VFSNDINRVLSCFGGFLGVGVVVYGVMSLNEFASEMESISGVKSVRMLEGSSVLQVTWQGEPADYSKQRRELRDAYPSVTQTSPPADSPSTTPDKMPVEYFVES